MPAKFEEVCTWQEIINILHLQNTGGNALVVQWLGLLAVAAKGPGLIPGWGTRILHVMQYGQKNKNKKTNTQIVVCLWP